jgi:hypothetical protein
MKERPILFSAPMVRAVLEGRKTQTRRVVKPRRDPDFGCELSPGEIAGEIRDGHYALCPHGVPGDRLWVREAFSGKHDYDAGHDGKPWPPSVWFQNDPIWYWADGRPEHGDWTRPRPSIHMPRWASRIALEVTGVRVERLQDISETDAKAEGIEFDPRLDPCGPCKWRHYGKPNTGLYPPQASFETLWSSINGADSWAADPWVWVVEFRRLAA